MRKLGIIGAFLLMGPFCFAQNNTPAIKEAIQRSADSMATAFKARNWKGIVHFSPPSVIEMAGGEDALVQMTESIMGQIPDSAIKEFSIGPVLQVVKTGKDWQCVVEQHMKMEINGMRITMVSPLIGQSVNNGASWTFFDSKGDRETALQFLPTLSNELVLPKSVQDVEQMNAGTKKPNVTPPGKE